MEPFLPVILIKGKNSIPFHDAFGGATPTTPYIPTNVNPPLTTDTTKARFNRRSIPVDSVLNSASENEDDDSLDSGSRKVAAIETTHENTSLQEIHNDLVCSYYKILSDLSHYKGQHSKPRNFAVNR